MPRQKIQCLQQQTWIFDGGHLRSPKQHQVTLLNVVLIAKPGALRDPEPDLVGKEIDIHCIPNRRTAMIWHAETTKVIIGITSNRKDMEKLAIPTTQNSIF